MDAWPMVYGEPWGTMGPGIEVIEITGPGPPCCNENWPLDHQWWEFTCRHCHRRWRYNQAYKRMVEV